jgi:hypothetical protein
MDRVYQAAAIELIRAHPLRYVLLSAYRFLPLWFNWGYPEAYGRKPSTTDYAVMVYQGILLILALFGLHRTAWQTWPLWGNILALSLIYMAVDSRLLYIIPVMPLVISLSAAGAMRLLRKLLPPGFDEKTPASS